MNQTNKIMERLDRKDAIRPLIRRVNKTTPASSISSSRKIFVVVKSLRKSDSLNLIFGKVVRINPFLRMEETDFAKKSLETVVTKTVRRNDPHRILTYLLVPDTIHT